MNNICAHKISYTLRMRNFSIVLSIALTITFLSTPVSTQAAFIDTGSEGRITSRQVERTTRYIHALEERNRRAGIVRRRSTDRDNTPRSYDRLRTPAVRRVRPSSTIPAAAARSKLFYSPTLNKRTRPSILSFSPVSVETEALYRNGIKYFTGEGGRQDSAFAFMWLNFALADGHPLAREALITVSRSLNPSQLEEAKERTKILSSKFLNYNPNRNAVIKDRLREQDLERILEALRRYWWRYGRYPVPVPTTRALEICKLDSATCEDRLDFMYMVPDFILTIPSDPNAEVGGNGTGYYILEQKDGSLLLFSQFSESEFVVVIGK